ncbi:sodium:calcium antiporter [Kordiimonas sediminis]|uniref:Sodium:calcium antiporter n=1 Tax=Kordiimonas sediminis TaxID=1735581 RepID=A0A919ASG7_9PROT|nr:calcium/sodium antiporter [Kordiimonas sediminis]GHF23213.1 sodium:calcium antiporter [Kordiimonas sediminis]
MAYMQIVLGLVLLVFAGDFLVRGAVSLAQRLGVPTLIIGLTIIAFGTSAPELVVAIDAVLSDAPTLALGNVVGSNVANILLVIGLPAIIAPIACDAPRLGRNLFIMIGVTLIFIGLAYTGGFGTTQGLILLAILAAFLFSSLYRAKSHPEAVDPLAELDGIEEHHDSMGLSLLMILGGLIGLVFGADQLVEGSVTVARALGVSEAVIGLTLVALGTSLPELVTAVVAAIRGHADVAVGSVIGSNLFNLLCIIGISSQFGFIDVPASFLEFDLWIMLLCSLILVPYYLRKRMIGRWSGMAMIIVYGSYMYYLATADNAAVAAMGL